MSYLLPEHVHVAVSQGLAVLLDVRTDKYHGFDEDQTRALSSVVQGWPVATGTEQINSDDAVALAEGLVEASLLTKDASGKTATTVQLPRPEMKLIEWDSAHCPAIRVADALQLAADCFTTAGRLKTRSLGHVFRRVQHRKRGSAGVPLDREAAARLVWTFRALRPLLYSAHNACLFDSLVLVEFLASYKLFPTLVIGIKAMPFAAHCWVQNGPSVLNGAPDYCRGFSPILAI